MRLLFIRHVLRRLMSTNDTPLSIPPAVWPLLDRLAQYLPPRGLRLVTAESCTGGLIAGCCTALSGSSVWLERGYVTYSNAAKTADLGVPATCLEQHGAVSEAVVRAMVEGACARSGASVGLAVTGIAGPTGGSADKPVGTVWFGWHVLGRTESECRVWPGDRAEVRGATVQHALHGLWQRLPPAG